MKFHRKWCLNLNDIRYNRGKDLLKEVLLRMLIQFKCSNYRSIREEIVFSMLATKDDTYSDYLLGTNVKLRLNPVCTIYGANGAGKTNLINAIDYLIRIVSTSLNLQYQDVIPYYPHKLSEVGMPSFFEIQFVISNVRYVYGLSLTEKEVVEEYLYYFPNGRQAKVFERQQETYSYGTGFKKVLSEIADSKMKPNRVFLSTAASWCNIEEILKVFDYIRNHVVVYQGFRNENWFEYTLQNLESSESFKREFIDFIQSMGIDIEDIEVKNHLMQLLTEDLPSAMPEELKSYLSGKQFKKSDILFKYPHMSISLSEESLGINKLFELGGPLIDILKNGKVLIFDELETSLHPNLVVHLIKLFLNPVINQNGAQLIFTTHDTNLLNLSLFRRDQIWFVEKTNHQSSDFYSLAHLNNVRKDENIEKGYIAGKYGSIPFLNNPFFLN